MKQNLINAIRWTKTFLREKFNFTSEDLPYYIIIVVAAILLATSLGVFIELTDELAENELEPYDKYVTEKVLSFRSDSLTSFFKFVTDLGDRNTYLIIIAVLIIFFWVKFKNWKLILQITGILILSSLSNVALKRVINRSRPSLEHLVNVNTLSFPSGHSMSAMAFYGFLIYLCLISKIPAVLKMLLITILSILILSIGLSRIYLGVHYPSDVAAGFVGGIMWVTFSAIVFNVIDLYRKKRKATSTL